MPKTTSYEDRATPRAPTAGSLRIDTDFSEQVAARRTRILAERVARGTAPRAGSRARATEIGEYLGNALIALVAIVVLSPLWLALAIAIKVESRGPVVYRATRVGRDAKPFEMFKFRKMHDGSGGALLTTKHDDRFTRIGSFLAKTKFDELPQLLNVVRGEMRLVGPRPEDPTFVARHKAMFAPVLSVRPGITGLCQIVYRDESALFAGDDIETWYERTLLPNKILVDLSYVRGRGFRLDAAIAGWTLVALLRPVSVSLDEAAGRVRFRLARASDHEGAHGGSSINGVSVLFAPGVSHEDSVDKITN